MNWRALEAAVDRKIAVSFGEPVTLMFMKGRTVDADRPAFTVEDAVLHTGGDDATPVGGGGEWRTRLSAGQAELFLDMATYEGPIPKIGDKVRADDRRNVPMWQVAGVSDRYSNLMVLSLTQLNKRPLED